MDGKWLDQSLTQIEGEDWGEPTYPSYVVTNGHRLRNKPLREFTTEDLRFMLTQQNSLPILKPMALDVLEVNPFVGGDMYEGALLYAAIQVDPQFWRDHQQLWYRLDSVMLVVRQFHKCWNVKSFQQLWHSRRLVLEHSSARTNLSCMKFTFLPPSRLT